tara:strand:- start:3453 stop:3968 length:516 start_codon:yes stop_codon:yes gene_type:complete
MAHFNPVEELLKARPELANGPHMNHIARDLIELSFNNAKSARRIAAAIMRSSPTRSSAMGTAAKHLLKAYDKVTEVEFQGVFEEYSKKRFCDTSVSPKNLPRELLQENTAFRHFIQMAIDYVDEPVGPDRVADEMIAMRDTDRNLFASRVVTGDCDWGYEKGALPLGCELE